MTILHSSVMLVLLKTNNNSDGANMLGPLILPRSVHSTVWSLFGDKHKMLTRLWSFPNIMSIVEHCAIIALECFWTQTINSYETMVLNQHNEYSRALYHHNIAWSLFGDEHKILTRLQLYGWYPATLIIVLFPEIPRVGWRMQIFVEVFCHF